MTSIMSTKYMQNKFYNLGSDDPQERALAAKAYIDEFVGPTIDPPTQEYKEANKHRTAEVIIEEFRNAVARKKTAFDPDSDDEPSDITDDTDNDPKPRAQLISERPQVPQRLPPQRLASRRKHPQPNQFGLCTKNKKKNQFPANYASKKRAKSDRES